jgi:hypothetical protein
MSSLDLRLFSEIETALADMLEKHATELISGRAVDWADYRGRVQYIKGLRDALEVSRQAQKRVLGVDVHER